MDGRVDIHQRVLYRWTIPAWVEGRWNCVVNDPAGRGHLVLRLKRKYQVLSGSAHLWRAQVPLVDAKLAGPTLSFTLPAGFARRAGAARFTGVMENGQLRGTCTFDGGDGRRVPWGGVRHA